MDLGPVSEFSSFLSGVEGSFRPTALDGILLFLLIGVLAALLWALCSATAVVRHSDRPHQGQVAAHAPYSPPCPYSRFA